VIPVLLILIGIGLFIGSSLVDRFLNEKSFVRDLSYRLELLKISFRVFLENPLGVGLNNYLYHQAPFQKTFSPILFQPVHNIYVLVLIQTGLIGLVLFLVGITRTLARLKKSMQLSEKDTRSFYEVIHIAIISLLFVGIFDHFLLTLQSGQLLFATIMGLGWSKFRG
jgi:O-antigen ligase